MDSGTQIPQPPERPIELRGIVLVEARSGERVDLGTWPELGLVTLIRHRH